MNGVVLRVDGDGGDPVGKELIVLDEGFFRECGVERQVELG